MSKPKSKAGKSKKAAKKSAPRKQVTARKRIRKAAPAAAAPAAVAAPKAPPEYPWNVVVTKGADKIPVTVTDEAHYTRLVDEFGAGHVEVQS